MCGRYRLTSVKRLAESFEAEEDVEEELAPHYNIAPTQPIPVVRQVGSTRMICSVRWGLIPSWAKDTSVSAKLFNCRSETILEKPSFRDSFRYRRCLIPADGFYEWKKTGKAKQPFHFGMKDASLFAFGGIWDRWRSPAGPVFESCSILTTTPNELLADIHDRMPVIVPRAHYEIWLTLPSPQANQLAEFLVPFDASQMRRYEVSPLVSHWQNEGPECAAPFARAPELS